MVCSSFMKRLLESSSVTATRHSLCYEPERSEAGTCSSARRRVRSSVELSEFQRFGRSLRRTNRERRMRLSRFVSLIRS